MHRTPNRIAMRNIKVKCQEKQEWRRKDTKNILGFQISGLFFVWNGWYEFTILFVPAKWMSFLRKVSPVRILRRAFARVINVESVPAFDKVDHIRNMKTEDLFQFEPFHNTDLLVRVLGSIFLLDISPGD